MNTLIESINGLMEIKDDLNNILNDNGIDGGPVFDSYPDKFRDLFRVLEGRLDDINEGPYDIHETITVVANPTIVYEYNNIVYITCSTAGAQIYFKTQDYGWTQYIVNFYITKDTYVSAYAILNGVRSSEVSKMCPYVKQYEIEPPTINRQNGVVTITHSDPNAAIWWRIYPTNYVRYTGSVNVSDSYTITAYASLNGLASEEVVSEGHGTEITVADPVLSCSDNYVSMTCSTEGAVIYYRVAGTSGWNLYSDPIPIIMDTVFEAYAYLEGNSSDVVTYTAQYVEPVVPPVIIPADPVFSMTGNNVTITCSTPNAVIYYREIGDIDFSIYTNPITITQDTDFEAYSLLAGRSSGTVNYSAEYNDPIERPADPVFSFSDNTVYLSCITSGADIYYRINGRPYWTLYDDGIAILEDTFFEAFSMKNNVQSNTVSYTAEYVAPVVPDDPVISDDYNFVTITCATSGAIIYYSTDGINYSAYTRAIEISQDTTLWAYSSLNGVSSNIVYKFIYYVEPRNNYVSIKCLDSGYISWKSPTAVPEVGAGVNGATVWHPVYEFRHNGGEWTDVSRDLLATQEYRQYYVNVSNGDTLQFRRKWTNSDFYYMQLNIDVTSNVYGNIMSMIDNTSSFKNNTTLVDNRQGWEIEANGGLFEKLFYDSKGIIDASNLILPATTLTPRCYKHMFFLCNHMTTAPELPATTLVESCYENMFTYCRSLNYIKCLATNISATNCTRWWTSEVQTNSGTFVKAASMNNWHIADTTFYDGIPANWSVVNAT